MLLAGWQVGHLCPTSHSQNGGSGLTWSKSREIGWWNEIQKQQQQQQHNIVDPTIDSICTKCHLQHRYLNTGYENVQPHNDECLPSTITRHSTLLTTNLQPEVLFTPETLMTRDVTAVAAAAATEKVTELQTRHLLVCITADLVGVLQHGNLHIRLYHTTTNNHATH